VMSKGAPAPMCDALAPICDAPATGVAARVRLVAEEGQITARPTCVGGHDEQRARDHKAQYRRDDEPNAA